MTTSTYDIAKCGWLWRQSSILRRWKRNWFALKLNGDLKIYDSKEDHEAEDSICIPVECSFFKQSYECEVDPPSEIPRNALFGIVTPERTMYCCAESLDDGQAWLYMLEQARTFRPSRRVTERVSGGQVPVYQSPVNMPMSTPMPVYDGTRGEYVVPQRVIHHPDGNTTIICADRPYCCHHRRRYCDCYCGRDASLGLVAGAATGALLLSPFMWGPFFWC